MATTQSLKKLRFAVVAVDAACFRIIAGELCVLLGRVNVEPQYKNRWGLIGGLIRAEENADEAVERHLGDKAGITGVYTEQLYTFSSIGRDPRGRVISVAYLCLAPEALTESGGEVETRWCPVADAPALAYDHDEILHTALERLRSHIAYTNVAQHLLPREFTLTDLQTTYEIVLNHKLDKRNFRKKVLETKLVAATNKKERKGASRPALLHRFSSSRIANIEIL
jgi:8-oxo-dGTP diphosphatase